MKQLLLRLFAVPFAAYFVNLFSLAVATSFVDIRTIMNFLGGSNTFPLYISWVSVLTLVVITDYFIRKK